MDQTDIRETFRPQRVRVLFLGESPPAGGTFFYFGNSRLFNETRSAFESAGYYFATPEAFLRFFQESELYLDDLCSTPINDLTRAERRARWAEERLHLTERLRELTPEAIVVVMKQIVPQVRQAAAGAGLAGIPMFDLPFPSYGNQRRFREQLAELLPRLLEERPDAKS